MITRRQFVWGSALALAGCQATPDHSRFQGPSAGPEGPFSIGVASGDPAADSVVLWTRLSAGPGDPRTVSVEWAIAGDREFSEVIESGWVEARAQHAYCVHVLAAGLRPDTSYFYRFRVADRLSGIGRTRTLPAPHTPTDSFRIALTSCQEYSVGFFNAYRDLSLQQPHLVLHNGDYIYESPAGKLRPYPFDGEARSLDDYRNLYALYRQDEYLRRAHAEYAWVVIWDDHEVVNDWGPDHYIPSVYNERVSLQEHRQRVTAARQAFLEHMPLRASLSWKSLAEPIFYRQDIIGDLLEISRFDVRSYRSTPVCTEGPDLEFSVCEEMHDTERSLLGPGQEQWFYERFGEAGCHWNCIAQTTVMAPFDRAAGESIRYETESWDNYWANRTRILDHIRARKIRNAVSLGGNIHAFYAGIVADSIVAGRCSRPVMTELITTSVSAAGGDQERYDDVNGRINENPCVQYFDNRQRGYALIDVNRERIRAMMRVVDSVEDEASEVSTLATVTVRDGHLGVEVSL